MDRDDTRLVAAVPAGRGYVGLRVGVVVAVLSALGALAGAGVGWVLEAREGRVAVALESSLSEHQEAGRLALESLNEVEAEVRAFERTVEREREERADRRADELIATVRAWTSFEAAEGAPPRTSVVAPKGWAPSRGEDVALLDLQADRVLWAASTSWVAGATVSVSLPEAKLLLHKREVPRTSHAWASAVAGHPGRYFVARVARTDGTVDLRGVERARRLLGSVAAPSDPVMPGQSLVAWMLAGAFLAALLGGLWGHWRLGGPLSRTLESSRAFVHGQGESRADEHVGGRDARDVARAVNQLIERAERLRAQGRSAGAEDVQQAAKAVEAMGRADLRAGVSMDLGEAFRPLERAIERARGDLLERVSGVHAAAAGIAEEAHQIAPAGRKIRDGVQAQIDALAQLQAAADEVTARVAEDAERLSDALDRLTSFAAIQRRTVQQARGSLAGLGRRVKELKGGAERVGGMIASAKSVEDALDLLAKAATTDRARASVAVGESRAALDRIRRELAVLGDEMQATAASLTSMAASVPEPVAGLEASVKTALQDAVVTQVRAVELAVAGLGALEQSARVIEESARTIQDGAGATMQLGPKLESAMAEMRVGDSFEHDLLARLERWKSEADEVERSGRRLTKDAEALVGEVMASSAAAQERLERLVQATERAIDILRG